MGGQRAYDAVADFAKVDPQTIKNWAKKYKWEKRAAQWDKEQVALTWQDAEKIREQHHKKSIVEFRDASERQARMMMEISEDLLGVIDKARQRCTEQWRRGSAGTRFGIIASHCKHHRTVSSGMGICTRRRRYVAIS